MLRIALLTLLAGALALPATSSARDPLLSGYAAPGGGEQALLGSRLSGGGSAGATTATTGSSVTPGDLRAPAPASATPSGGAPTSPGSADSGKAPTSHSTSSGDARKKTGAGSSGTAKSGASAPTATPQPVAYPARADDAGGFPFSAGEVLAGALALLAVAGMGAWLRRTGTHGGDPGAQASA